MDDSEVNGKEDIIGMIMDDSGNERDASSRKRKLSNYEDSTPKKTISSFSPQEFYSSAKRERKMVERLDNSTSKKDVKKINYEEGQGTKLGELPRVEHNISKVKKEVLKPLHRILFGISGKNHEIKKNIRLFSGFVFNKDSEDYKKRLASLTHRKMFTATLKTLCRILDISTMGTKDELSNKIMNFLMAPHPSGHKLVIKKKSTKKRILNKKKSEKLSSTKKSKTSNESSSDINSSISESESNNEDQKVTDQKELSTKNEKTKLVSKKTKADKSNDKKKILKEKVTKYNDGNDKNYKEKKNKIIVTKKLKNEIDEDSKNSTNDELDINDKILTNIDDNDDDANDNNFKASSRKNVHFESLQTKKSKNVENNMVKKKLSKSTISKVSSNTKAKKESSNILIKKKNKFNDSDMDEDLQQTSKLVKTKVNKIMDSDDSESEMKMKCENSFEFAHNGKNENEVVNDSEQNVNSHSNENDTTVAVGKKSIEVNKLVDSDDEPILKRVKFPTEEEIIHVIKTFLNNADLSLITMKSILIHVDEQFKGTDLSHKKDFIKKTVKDLI